MYFYDDRGSELFQAISRHPDYYLTRTEHFILTSHADEIFSRIDRGEIDVVELGVGDGHKTQILLNAFSRGGKSISYYPIDIPEEAIRLLKTGLDLPSNVSLNSIVADHFSGLDELSAESRRTKLVLFLGSSIGNFNPALFQYFGTYNPIIGVMDSYLVASSAHSVNIGHIDLSVSKV